MNPVVREARERLRALAAEFSGPPRFPPAPAVSGLLAPLLCAGLLTWWARATGFDLEAQRWIHRVGGGSWSLGEHPFWKCLYLGGTFPATLVVFAAFGAFAASWRAPRLRPWRRVLLFLVLAGVAGPGLVANALLKECSGRPRPRELVEFGGRSQFEPAFSFEAASEGKSFPCGHATMGFYFLAFPFLLRRHRPRCASAATFASLALGGLMGLARMAQGAHFFTDVVWAAAVCWAVPWALHRAMGLDRRLVRDPTGDARRMSRPLRAGLACAAAGLAFAVLLATPHREKTSFTLSPAYSGGPLLVRLVLASGEVEIVPGPAFRIEAEAEGHGAPTSKIGRFYEEEAWAGGGRVLYAERISGWFHELRGRVRVEIPWERTRFLKIDAGASDLVLELAGGAGRPVVQILSGTGRVTVRPRGQRLRWVPEADPRVAAPTPPAASGDGATLYRVDLGDAFAGRVEVAPPPP